MTVSALRCTWRALAVIVHISTGLMLAASLRLVRGRHWHRSPMGERTVRWWMRRLCRIIGLRLRRRGSPLRSAHLVAANHVSWLDVVAIAAFQPTLFVAKSEVRDWPLLGALATLSGTVFIRRHRLSEVARTVDRITELLLDGQTVTVFPEASTSEGDSVAAFHGAPFQSAIGAEVPVQAVSIRYLQAGTLDRQAAFVGDDTFVLHLLRLLARPSTSVELHFCQPLGAPHQERRLLAMRTRELIVHSLTRPPPVPLSAASTLAGAGQ